MWNTDLLTMPLVTDLLQFVLTDRNAADPPDVVAIWQLDGMADMLAIVRNRAICSLSPIFPEKLKGMLSFHKPTVGSLVQKSGHCTCHLTMDNIHH